MSIRQFHKVAPPVWRSKRFLSLTDDARLLWFFFATGPHQTSAGCCRVPMGYGPLDLGWSAKRYEDARALLATAEMVVFDEATDELFVCRWFQHCPPSNAKHAAGVASIIGRLDSDVVRDQAESEFVATVWGERFLSEPSCAG